MIPTTKAAAILGVSTYTLHNWRKDGFGPQPIEQFGRAFAYDEQEVIEFAAMRAKVMHKPSGS